MKRGRHPAGGGGPLAAQGRAALSPGRRLALAALAATSLGGVVGVVACGSGSSAAGDGETDAGAARDPAAPGLRRGVNLSHWFEYERGQAVNADEFRALRQLGLDHVRIPVDPVVFGWSPLSGGALSFERELEWALAAALDAGLEVVIDLHFTPETKAAMETRREADDALARLWSQLAARFSGTPADRVAFELYNEPQYYGSLASRWPPLQRRLLQALRQEAPTHLVLLSGAQGGSVAALTELAPEPDARVAYVFHHYEPFLFTHQGASWLDERYTTAGLWSNLRYPPEQQAGHEPVLAHPHPRAADELDAYLAGSGAELIRTLIEPAAAWARSHRVRVLCNEFGAIRADVDPPSRYRWLADVRGTLEARRIGWTVWDYTDIFGLTPQSAQPGQTGLRALEPAAVTALGLTAPGVQK